MRDLPATSRTIEKLRAVRRPVGLLDALRHAPRRASRQGRARECARADARVIGAAVERDRHLAGRRDPEQVRARQLQRERVRARRVLEKELQRVAVPRDAVDDRLAVGGETRGADRAAAEGDLLVGRRRRLAKGASPAACRPGARRRSPRRSAPRAGNALRRGGGGTGRPVRGPKPRRKRTPRRDARGSHRTSLARSRVEA